MTNKGGLVKLQKSVMYILPRPYFFSQASGVGGHIGHFCGIAKALCEEGYNVRILADEQHECLNEMPVKVDVLPSPMSRAIGRQLWNYKLLRKAKKRIKESAPTFCYVRHSAGFSLWMPILRKVLGKTPLVLEVNSIPHAQSGWSVNIQKLALVAADLIVTVSEKMRTQIVRDVCPRCEDKIIVVPNAVDIARFEKDLKYRSRDSVMHVAYAGILKPDYGLEVMIEAFQKMVKQRKDVCFHIYGDGPLRSDLEKQANNEKRIIFHGAKRFIDIPKILAENDVLVNTGSVQVSGGSPVKLFEYMAAGKPIVHARYEQVEAILQNNITGLLYQASEPDDLVEKVSRLLDNRGLAEQLGKSARRDVEKNHTWSNRVAVICEELSSHGLLRY